MSYTTSQTQNKYPSPQNPNIDITNLDLILLNLFVHGIPFERIRIKDESNLFEFVRLFGRVRLILILLALPAQTHTHE